MNAILTDTSAGPLSRRDLLKGGGALVVGFCIGGSALPASAARGDAAGPPDPNTIDSWIAVHADNTATVYLGKGEFGQGNTTGLLQIAGEELDLDMNQLRSVQLDTNTVPNQGATTSSSSIHRGGPQVRAAAAEARQALLALASTRLGVQTGSLTVVQRGGIDRRPSQPLGQLRRAARRQAVQRQVHRHRAAEADQPVQARGHARAAGRYSGQDDRKIRLHAAGARARHAARPHRAATRARRLWRRRQALEHRRELDRRHSRRADRAQGRLRRRGRGARVGRGQGRACAQGDLEGERDAAGQCRPVRAHARRQDHRHGDRGLGRCGQGLRRGRACGVLELSLPVPVARPVRRQLRARRCRPERRAGDVLDPGHLQFARHAGGGARIAGRQGPRAVLRGLGHVRPQLLRGRRAGRGGHVAGGRQAGARAVHAFRRARLGRLRPGASGGRARRHRCRRKARGLRISRLAARLDGQRDDARTGAADCRRRSARPAPAPSPSTA